MLKDEGSQFYDESIKYFKIFLAFLSVSLPPLAFKSSIELKIFIL